MKTKVLILMAIVIFMIFPELVYLYFNNKDALSAYWL